MFSNLKCPKCHNQREPDAIECPFCGIFYKKFKVKDSNLQEKVIKNVQKKKKLQKFVRHTILGIFLFLIFAISVPLLLFRQLNRRTKSHKQI